MSKNILQNRHLLPARMIQRSAPSWFDAPGVVVAVTMEATRQTRIPRLSPHQERSNRESVLLTVFVSPFQHRHRFGRTASVIGQRHRINGTNLVPDLNGIETQPRLIVHETRAGG